MDNSIPHNTVVRSLSFPSQNKTEEEEEDEKVRENRRTVLKSKRSHKDKDSEEEEEEEEENNEKTVKPLKFPFWIYFLFFILFAILFVVPYAIKYLPHDDVVIQITRDEVAKNPVYSKEHNLYYFVDDATFKRTKKIPSIFLFPIHHAANKLISTKIKICHSTSLQQFTQLVNMSELLEKAAKREAQEKLRKKQKEGKVGENKEVNIPINQPDVVVKPTKKFFSFKEIFYSSFRYVYVLIQKQKKSELERENEGYADSYQTIKIEKTGTVRPDPELERKKEKIWKEQKEKTCDQLAKLRGISDVYLKEDSDATSQNINEILKRIK